MTSPNPSISTHAWQTLQGIVAPFLLDDIDTDVIIPQVELVAPIGGYGAGLFAGLRYVREREPDEDFVLNQQPFQSASVLIAGRQFGCGSSREHAVWALHEFGIRCILAESYGPIFYRNCLQNAVAPLELPRPDLEKLAGEAIVGRSSCEVDLTGGKLTVGTRTVACDVPDVVRQYVCDGADDIADTFARMEMVTAYERRTHSASLWRANSQYGAAAGLYLEGDPHGTDPEGHR